MCLAAGMNLFVACGDNNKGEKSVPGKALIEATTKARKQYEDTCKKKKKKSAYPEGKIVLFVDAKKSSSGKTCTSWEDACKSVEDAEKVAKTANAKKTDVVLKMVFVCIGKFSI